MLIVEVADGQRSRTVVVDDVQVSVGRVDDCAIVLPGDSTVSRTHAVFTCDAAGQWWVRDAGSRNGTRLNGSLVQQPTVFNEGDRVAIGGYTLLRLGGSAADVETVAASELAASRLQLKHGLTAREVEVLALVSQGRTDQQVADALFLSVKTIHSHLDRIRDKTGLRRRPELVALAAEVGLVGS